MKIPVGRSTVGAASANTAAKARDSVVAAGVRPGGCPWEAAWPVPFAYSRASMAWASRSRLR